VQLIHESLYDDMVPRLINAYKTVPIGSPLDDGTLMGPLHSEASIETYGAALEKIAAQVRGCCCVAIMSWPFRRQCVSPPLQVAVQLVLTVLRVLHVCHGTTSK